MNDVWKNLHQKKEFIPPKVSPQFSNYINNQKTLTKVIEIGCGQGRNIKYTASLYPGKEIYATDIYPELEKNINSRSIESKVCDMRECPISSEYLSHVISWRVLHHHEKNQRDEAMEEIRRIVMPGGTLLMAVRSVKDWSYRIGTPTEENSFVVLDQKELPSGLTFFPKEKYHPWHFFTEKEIVDIINKHGFELNDFGHFYENASIPKWYNGSNAYWMLRATKIKKSRIFNLGGNYDRLL